MFSKIKQARVVSEALTNSKSQWQLILKSYFISNTFFNHILFLTDQYAQYQTTFKYSSCARNIINLCLLSSLNIIIIIIIVISFLLQ